MLRGKTVIVFRQDVAPMLDLNDPIQSALRMSIMDPRRHPYVRTIGHTLGQVLNLSEPAKMPEETVKERDALVDVEMAVILEGNYNVPGFARAGLKELFDKAYYLGQKSRDVK